VKHVTAGSLRMAVHAVGSGRPLVLLHGFPMDHRMWSGQEPLADAVRLIAPDLRGFGASHIDPGSRIESIQQLADDVAALLEALHVTEPVTVCGLSMGGYVAQHLAARHPRLVGSLILCDTRFDADTAQAREARSRLSEHVARHGAKAAAEAMLPNLLAARHEPTPADRARRELVREMILATPAETIRQALAALAARPDMTACMEAFDRPTLLVVGEEHAGTVLEQIPDMPRDNLVLEPEARGTAPCISLAALVIRQRDPEAVMGVFPADHRIAEAARFREAIAAAARVAGDDYLVTLGIAPDEANTGYGYIQRGESLDAENGFDVYRVRRFTEKPDEKTARSFVESGEYYWNGGIFVWKVATILDEIEVHLPHLYKELGTISDAWETDRRSEVLATAWQRVPKTTIDYGIMEKASRVATIPVDIGWDDVGNWANLSDLLEGDEEGNVARGKGRSLLLDTSDTYVYASAGRLVAVAGLKDFVIVDTPDALLICPKDRAQDVRDVVQQIEEQGLDEYL